MKENRGKEKKSRLPVLMIVSSTVFLSFMLSFFLGQNGILRLRELQQEYDHLMLENHRLALENRKTSLEIDKLRHDPSTVEKIAREELFFVSPQDIVLVATEEEKKEASASQEPQ